MINKNLAHRAYEAYGKVTDFKNFQGNPMPRWEDLPRKIQEAWDAAAQSILEICETDEAAHIDTEEG